MSRRSRDFDWMIFDEICHPRRVVEACTTAVRYGYEMSVHDDALCWRFVKGRVTVYVYPSTRRFRAVLDGREVPTHADLGVASGLRCTGSGLRDAPDAFLRDLERFLREDGRSLLALDRT